MARITATQTGGSLLIGQIQIFMEHLKPDGSEKCQLKKSLSTSFSMAVKAGDLIYVYPPPSKMYVYPNILLENIVKTRSNTRHDFYVENPCGKNHERQSAIFTMMRELQGIQCRMDLPGPTTSVGTRTDYSVGPWDYPTCATRHLKAWSTRTTRE
jgi:hypothetical protein